MVTLLGVVLYFGGIWYLMLRLAVAVIRRYRKMRLWDMKGYFIPMKRERTSMTGPAWTVMRSGWQEAGAIAWPMPGQTVLEAGTNKRWVRTEKEWVPLWAPPEPTERIEIPWREWSGNQARPVVAE